MNGTPSSERKVFISSHIPGHYCHGVWQPKQLPISAIAAGPNAKWTHLYFRTISGNSYCIYNPGGPGAPGGLLLKKADNPKYGHTLTPQEAQSLMVVVGDQFVYGDGQGQTGHVLEIIAINRRDLRVMDKTELLSAMPTTIHVPFDYISFCMQKVDDTSGPPPQTFDQVLLAMTKRAMSP